MGYFHILRPLAGYYYAKMLVNFGLNVERFGPGKNFPDEINGLPTSGASLSLVGLVQSKLTVP